MSNPWLRIALSDYEGHMNSPEVGQLDTLADLFSTVLELLKPSSVAILGIAGGNGVDRIDPAITKRVVGIDINPLYLAEVERRYANQLNLELRCEDLAAKEIECQKVQLVHAALIFEHAGLGLCLENALKVMDDDGTISVILQVNGGSAQHLAKSEFPAMQALRDNFCPIDVRDLTEEMSQRGLRMQIEAFRSLPGDKGFWLGAFCGAQNRLQL